jgi:hypothetical protein
MIKLIGDSHAHVVRKAIAGNENRQIDAAMLEVGRQFLEPFHKVSGEQITFTHDKMSQRFKTAIGQAGIQRGERYYISLGLHGIAFYHAKTWADCTISLDRDDRQLISKSAFRIAVLNFNKYIFKFLADCQANDVDVIIVAAPYLHAAYYGARKKRPVTEAEYYETDYQYRRVVTSRLDEMGIKIILPPPECYENGYLLPEFCRDTGYDYHGNDLYGAQVAEQLLKFEETGEISGFAPPRRDVKVSMKPKFWNRLFG